MRSNSCPTCNEGRERRRELSGDRDTARWSPRRGPRALDPTTGTDLKKPSVATARNPFIGASFRCGAISPMRPDVDNERAIDDCVQENNSHGDADLWRGSAEF